MNAQHKPEAVTVEADLLDHYQLNHDPFLPRTPGFRFFTARRKSVLAELHHLARFAQQLLVVTGPPSSGKTLLRQVLVASSKRDTVQCIVVSAREVASPDALIVFLAQTINAPVPSESGLLERTDELLRTGIQLYIVVDDAHLLPPQALQSLADISQVDGRAAPRIFLFGEPAIEASLSAVDMPNGRAWLHVIELQPFRPEETRDYLAQRLEAAGQGLELLSEEQLDWIHQQSEGWPGRINVLGRESMLAAIEPPVLRSQRGAAVFPVRSLIALVLVSAAVIGVWLMGGEEPEPTRTVLELPAPAARVEAMDAAAPEPQQFTVPPPPSRATEPATQPIPELVPSEELPLADIEPFSIEQPEPPAQPTATTAPQAPPVEQSAPAQAERSASPEHVNWYRQQPPGSYALQLLGSRSRQAALDFMAGQSSLSELRYFETLHEGKPWFVVTQGSYPGRQQAQQAIAGLPENARKLQPWPRSMGSIQESLL